MEMWERKMLRSRAITQSCVIDILHLISTALSPGSENLRKRFHYFHAVTINCNLVAHGRRVKHCLNFGL